MWWNILFLARFFFGPCCKRGDDSTPKLTSTRVRPELRVIDLWASDRWRHAHDALAVPEAPSLPFPGAAHAHTAMTARHESAFHRLGEAYNALPGRTRDFDAVRYLDGAVAATPHIVKVLLFTSLNPQPRGPRCYFQ